MEPREDPRSNKEARLQEIRAELASLREEGITANRGDANERWQKIIDLEKELEELDSPPR